MPGCKSELSPSIRGGHGEERRGGGGGRATLDRFRLCSSAGKLVAQSDRCACKIQFAVLANLGNCSLAAMENESIRDLAPDHPRIPFARELDRLEISDGG